MKNRQGAMGLKGGQEARGYGLWDLKAGKGQGIMVLCLSPLSYGLLPIAYCLS